MKLTLTREVTCIRSMAWRCDLPVETNWKALSTELESSGLRSLPPLGVMHRFCSQSGDELVFVTTSGRVQFRVHYTVPQLDRRYAAERLFQILVYALRRL
jgi:hypothetical protein